MQQQAVDAVSPTQGKGKEDAKFWSNLPEIADVLDSDKLASAIPDGTELLSAADS